MNNFSLFSDRSQIIKQKKTNGFFSLLYQTVLINMHLKIAVIIKQMFLLICLSKLPDVLARGTTKLADWRSDVPNLSPILFFVKSFPFSWNVIFLECSCISLCINPRFRIWGMDRFVYRSTGRQNCSSKYPPSLKRLYASRVWLPPVTSIVAVFGFLQIGDVYLPFILCFYNPYQGCIETIWHFYLGTNVCRMVCIQSPDRTVFWWWEQVCQEHKDSWTYKVEVRLLKP